MSEKKLLLITPDFPPMTGGVARYLKELARYFKDDIEVVASPHPQWHIFDQQAPFPIYRQPLLYKWMWPKWLKTVRFLKRYQDRYRLIITSHLLPYGSACMLAQRKTGVPYAVIVHGMDLRLAKQSSKKRKLAQKVLKNAKLVVANSSALAQEIAQDFGVNEILVVHPCIPERIIETQKTTDKFRLLTVSRLVERKGHQHVLNVLSHLLGAGKLSNVQYDIVGEGPMEQSLKEMVNILGLEEEVIFHGRVSEEQKDQLYAQADVFVMPVEKDKVDKEGFGYVFIEAGEYEVPSISTKIPGVDEAILHGETGWLISGDSEEELAWAIQQLYKDDDLRQQFGNAAKTHASNFTCKKQFDKLKPYL